MDWGDDTKIQIYIWTFDFYISKIFYRQIGIVFQVEYLNRISLEPIGPFRGRQLI